MIPWRARAAANSGATPRSVKDGVCSDAEEFRAGEEGITTQLSFETNLRVSNVAALAAKDQDSLVSKKLPVVGDDMITVREIAL
jgi:hypothetical protein